MAILQSTTISGSNANTGSLQVTGSTVIFPLIESSLTSSFSGSGKMWINADTQNLQYTFQTSLGTVNSTANGVGFYNNIIGKSTFIAKDYMSDFIDNGVQIASLQQGGADSERTQQVIECEPDSGANVGYDKLYVAMLAEGAFDFTTAAEISRAVDVSEMSAAQLVNADIEGTDPRLCFAPGDIIHAADDVVIGEIESMADANTITFKTDGSKTTSETDYTVPADLAAWIAATGDLADGDELINVNPLKFILHFER